MWPRPQYTQGARDRGLGTPEAPRTGLSLGSLWPPQVSIPSATPWALLSLPGPLRRGVSGAELEGAARGGAGRAEPERGGASRGRCGMQCCPEVGARSPRLPPATGLAGGERRIPRAAAEPGPEPGREHGR